MGQTQPTAAPPPPELVEDVAGSVTIGPQHTLTPSRLKVQGKSHLTSMFDEKEETDDEDAKETTESLGDRFKSLSFGQQKAMERALAAYRDVLNPIHLRRIKQHQWKLDGSMADFKLELWEPPVVIPGFAFIRVVPADFATQEWQTVNQAIVRLSDGKVFTGPEQFDLLVKLLPSSPKPTADVLALIHRVLNNWPCIPYDPTDIELRATTPDIRAPTLVHDKSGYTQLEYWVLFVPPYKAQYDKILVPVSFDGEPVKRR